MESTWTIPNAPAAQKTADRLLSKEINFSPEMVSRTAAEVTDFKDRRLTFKIFSKTQFAA